jgi:hypothetical protein
VGEGNLRWFVNKLFERGIRKDSRGESSKEIGMPQKTLEPDSKFAKYDLDGDGVVTDEELNMDARMMRLENEDKKEDAQRKMAWFALAGMLLYPFAVVIAMWVGLTEAGKTLGSMAPTYFVSVAAIVAAFYAKNAYQKTTEVNTKK